MEQTDGRKISRPIFGFVHICTMNDWLDIVVEQLETMTKSGLLDKARKIYCGVVGDGTVTWVGKLSKIYQSHEMKLYEYPTLVALRSLCFHLDPCYIFYIHTKGISYRGKFDVPPDIKKRTDDWRKYLEYYIIGEKHDACIDELEANRCEIVGVNWHGYGTDFHPGGPHFSGNFWWAKSEYIKTLPIPKCVYGHKYERAEAEFWIGKGTDYVACSLNESGVNHYKERYQFERYEDRINRKWWRVSWVEEETKRRGFIRRRMSFPCA